jgi:hypothetical protein
LWLDHLSAFKRLKQAAARETGAEKQSFALENVARYVLKEEGKTKGESGEALGSKTWELS